jgi:hypothetical protein
MPRDNQYANRKKLNSQQSVNSAIKSICDIMRRSNCAGALQYVPELTWILFLRILDERETHEAETAEAVGAEYQPSLEAPYRWQDWAAPTGGEEKRTRSWNAWGIQGLCGRGVDSPPQAIEGTSQRRITAESDFRNLLRH